MPQAVDTAGNIWETDAQGNPVRYIGKVGGQAGQPNPLKVQQVETQVQGSQLDNTGKSLSNQVDQATMDAQIRKANADAQAAEIDAQNKRFILEHGGQTPEQLAARSKDVHERARMLNPLVDQIRRTEELYKAGPGSTTPYTPWAAGDYLPSPANNRFDTAGSQLSQQGLGAFKIPGQGTISDRDAIMFDRANLPNSWNNDASNEEILRGIKARVESEYRSLGLPPPDWASTQQDNRQPAPGVNPPGNVPPPGSGPIPGGNTPPQMGLSSGPAYSTPSDLAISSAVNSAFSKGGSVQDMVAAAQSSGANVTPQDIANFQQAVKARSQGQGAVFNPQQTGRRNAVSQALGSALLNPAGTAVATGTNAAGFGILERMNPNLIAGLRSINPSGSIAGDIAGTIAGSGMVGKAGKKIAAKFAPSLLKGGKWAQTGRNLATDATYGGAYGGVTDGDPLTGAAAGAFGSALGQGGSKVIGKALGGVDATAASEALRNAGVTAQTVGQRLGGVAKGFEDRLSGIPVIGDMVNARRLEGLRQFNDVAMNRAVEPIGGKAAGIGNDGIQALYDQVGNSYDSATSGVNIPVDAQFGSDIAAIRGRGIPGAPDLETKLNGALTNRVAPIEQSGQLTGDAYQQSFRGLKGYRAEHTKPGFEQDYRDQLTAAMDALTGQMQRGGGDSVVNGLRNADKAYRGIKTLDQAVTAARNGTGSGELQVFTPAQLNNAATKTAQKFGGERPFADLIDAGQSTLPNKIPDSGTAGRLATLALPGVLTGAGAGAGYAGGNAQSGAGMGLTIGALLAAGGTRAGQRALAKAIFDRPDMLALAGRSISKRQGLFGTASVPLLLEGGN